MVNVPNGNSQAEHPSRRKAPTQQQSELAALSRRQQYQRDYHRTHRAHLAALRRNRYKKNPAPALLATKQWIAKNRERRRQQQQAWYQRKLLKLRAKHRAYYRKYREEARLRSREYYATHRLAVRARQRRYYYRKKHAAAG